jgi:CubicO group peptidase (beta-lactamase class C family)
VTIENLLTHTSGISDLPGQQPPLPELLKNYRSVPLAFTPGTKWIYSNINYLLLGYIIEGLSKMAYPDYLKKNALAPAGMLHTYYGSNEAIVPERVPGYIKSKKGNFQNSYMFIAPSAAGALLSCTTDLLKWNQALVSGELIRKETLAKAWSSYRLADGKNSNYGYGWQTGGEIQGDSMVEHGGVAVGYLTDAIYLPHEDVYVVVLTNQRGVSAEMVAGLLVAAVIGKPFNTSGMPMPEDSLKNYVGVYRPENDTVGRHITLTDGKLYYQRTGGPRMLMIPCAPDRFFFDNTIVTGQIKRDVRKRIISLQLFNNRHPSEPTDELKKEDTPLSGK